MIRFSRISTILLFLLFIAGITFKATGQANDCGTSSILCNPNASFSANTGQPNLGAVDCLGTTPNPAFFTFNIAQSGDLHLLTTNTANVDIDFAIWGPFSSPTGNCGGAFPSGAPVDCSYSPSADENIDVPGVQEGEYYILLLTNFANASTQVLLNPTGANTAVLGGPGSILASGSTLSGNTFHAAGPYSAVDAPRDLITNPTVTDPNFTNENFSGTGITNSVNGTFDPVGLAIGTYSVTLTGTSYSCGITDTKNIAVVCPPDVATPTNNGPVCPGNSVTLSVPSGNTGNSFLWSGPSSFASSSQNPIVSNAAAGTYTVTVTASNGCTATGTTVVSLSSAAARTASNTSPYCEGADISLAVSPAGTSYNWAGPGGFSSTNQNPTIVGGASSATAGVYTVTVTDSGGCTTSASTTVTINAAPAAPATTSASACQGDVVPSLSATPPSCGAAPTAPVTVTKIYSGPTVSVDAATAPAGTLSFTTADFPAGAIITDVSLQATLQKTDGTCDVPDTGTPFFNEMALDLTTPAGTVTLISGTHWTATGSGPTSPFTVSWNTASVTMMPNTVPPVSGGPYQPDAGSFSGSIGTSAIGDYSMTIIDDVNLDPSCLLSWQITITAQVPVGPPTPAAITWYDAASGGTQVGSGTTFTPPISTATPGTYTFYAGSNCGGCVSTRTSASVVVIPRPQAPQNVSYTLCQGGTLPTSLALVGSSPSTGSDFNVFDTDGSPMQTGVGSANLTLSNVDVNTAGVYTLTYTQEVTVGSVTCESAVGTITVTVNSGPATPIINSNTPVCEGGTLNLFTGSAPGGLSYLWAGPNGFSSSQQNPSISNVTTATAGNYTVRVTGQNGCSATSAPHAVSVNTVSGSIAPFTYTCGGGTSNINLPTPSVSPAGGTYSWTGPNGFASTSASPLIANADAGDNGTYSVVYTSTDGCSVSLSTVLAVNAQPGSVNMTTGSTVCEGEDIVISSDAFGNAGTTYTWSGPSGLIVNNSSTLTISNAAVANAGNYSVTVTAPGNGGPDCISTGSVSVNVNPRPSYTVTNNASACATPNSNFTLSATAGVAGSAPFTFNWTGPNGWNATTTSNTVSLPNTPASQGTYNVVVTDGNGCSSIAASTNVNTATVAVSVEAGSDMTICSGASATLTALASNPAATISWYQGATLVGSGSSITVSPSISTLYTVSASLNGCSGSDNVTVNVNSAPVIVIDSIRSACSNSGRIALAVSVSPSNASGFWSGPVDAYGYTNAFAAGAYTVSYTASINGCEATASKSYNVYDCSCAVTDTVCFGESVIVTLTNPASGGYTQVYYLVDASSNLIVASNSTGNFTVDALSGHSYRVYALNYKDADAPSPLPQVGLTIADFGNTTHGCMNNDFFTDYYCFSVHEVPQPVATNSGPVCAGTAAQLFVTGKPTDTYSWSGGLMTPTAQNPMVSTSAASPLTTTYTVTVTSNAGCSNTATTTLTVNPNPVYSLSNDAQPCAPAGNTFTLTATAGATAGTSPLTFNWSGPNGWAAYSSTNTSIRPNVPANQGTYSVVVTDVNGCTSQPAFTTVNVATTAITVQASADQEICASGSVSLTASASDAAATYQWYSGAVLIGTGASVTVSPTSTTLYDVIANLNGCTATDNVTVNVNPLPNISIDTIRPICTNSGPVALSVNYTPSGGTGVWSGAVDALGYTNASGNGTYTATYTVTTAAGCTATESMNYNVYDCSCAMSDTICQGSPVVVTSIGSAAGYTQVYYLVDEASNLIVATNTTGDFTNSVVVNHTYRVYALNYNPADAPNPLPSLNHGIGDFGNISHGCMNIDFFTDYYCFSVRPVPQPVATNNGPVCAGTAAQLFVTGNAGGTYSWASGLVNPTVQNPTVSTSGSSPLTTIYTVTVTSIWGCSNTATTTLTVNPNPVISIDSIRPICTNSGPVALAVDYTPSIATGTWGGDVDAYGFTNAFGNGTYTATYTVTTDAGCTSTESTTYNVYNCDCAVTDTICAGSPVVVSSPGSAAGYIQVYYLVDQASNLIVATNTTGNFTNDVIVNHDYRVYALNYNPADAPSPLPSVGLGIGVFGNNGHGCMNTDFFTDYFCFSVHPVPQPVATNSGPVCAGTTAQLFVTGSAGDTYSWASGLVNPTAQNPMVSTSNASSLNTVYTVTVTSIWGCSNTATTTLTVNPTPVYTLTNDAAACAAVGSTFTLTAVAGATPGTAPLTFNWTGPNGWTATTSTNTNTRPNMPSSQGTYSVVVTDANGCVSQAAFTTVNIATEAITLQATGSTICAGQSGTVTADAFQGVNNVNANYNWYLGAALVSSGQTINVSPAATTTYTIVADYQGCTATATAIVTVNPTPVYTLTNDAAACAAVGSTFTLTAVAGATPGTAPLTFNWTGPNGWTATTSTNTTTRPNMPSSQGTYSVIVTDANGCVSQAAFTTVNIATEAITLQTTGSTICAGQSGTVTADAFQGVNNVNANYNWYQGTTLVSSGQTISVSPAATTTYTIVADYQGCTATATAIVTVNPTPVYTLTNDATPCGATGSNFTLTATAGTTPGTAPLTFNWTGPNAWTATTSVNTTSLPNLPASQGTYSVVVTDANGCVSQAAFTTVNTATQAITVVGTGDTTACNGVKLEMTATAYQGINTVNATYSWYVGGTLIGSGPFIQDSPTSSTTYTVVADYMGCTASDNIVITINPNPVVHIEPIPTVCTVSGSVQVTGNSNIPGTGVWSGDINSAGVISISTPGVYHANYTVTTAAGCSSNALQFYNVVACNCAQTDDYCEGSPIDYTFTPTVAANESELYVLVNSTSGLVVATNTTGTFTNNVTPNNSYRVHRLIYQTASAPNALPSVGSAPGMIGAVTMDSINADYLSNYACFTVRPTPMPVASNSGPLCSYGDVQLFVTGSSNSSYAWSSPSGSIVNTNQQNTTAYNLSATETFTVTVTDQYGCSADTSTTVIVNTPIVLDASNDAVECMDPTDDIHLFAQVIGGTAPFTYLWNNFGSSGAFQFTTNAQNPVLPNVVNLYSGTYFVTVTDANGCMAFDSTVVDATVRPNLPIIIGNSPICGDKDLSLSVQSYPSNTVVYHWILPNGSVTTSSSNTYFVSNPVIGTHDGAYQVVVEVDGCMSDTSTVYNVEIFEVPVIDSITGGGSYCQGANITLDASITYNSDPDSLSFSWTGPNNFTANTEDITFTSALPAISGTYILTVNTLGGCSDSYPVTILVTPIPNTPTLYASDNTLCGGDSLNLTTTPYTGTSVSYEWFLNGASQGTTTAPNFIVNPVTTNNAAGNWQVAVTVNGCVSLFSAQNSVSVGASPTATAVNATIDNPLDGNPASTTLAVCAGTNVLLGSNFNPNWSYTWTGPGGFNNTLNNPTILNASELNEGVYTVYVTNNVSGCFGAYSVTLTVNAVPNVATAVNDSPACAGSDVELDVTAGGGQAGYTYTWYDADTNLPIGTGDPYTLTSVTIGDAGNYYVIVTSPEGCSSLASNMTSVTVDTIDNQAAYAGIDMIYCGEPAIQLSAEQPQFGNGLWTTSDPTIHIANPNVNNTTAYNLPSGITEFVWTIYNGVCGGYVSDTVSIQYAPPVNAVNDTVSTDIGVAIPAINVVLNDVTGNTAGWSVGILQEPSHGTAVNNGDGTFGYTPNGGYSGMDAFTYQICSSVCPDLCDTASVIISIGGEITCVDEIPNLFTPNGDGQNDEFFVSCADTYLNNELQIFNRWGDKVYQAAPYHNDWYGTYGGSDLPEGTYFYIFKYKDDNGVEQKASGYVMIHR